MTSSHWFKLVLCSALLAGQAAACAASASATVRDDPVVDARWLAAHVDDPHLVLLHVGDRDEYAAGHIRGARLVSLDDVSVSEHTRDGLMLEMPDAQALRERLEKLGISDDSHIVVYYGNDWVSPSTRVVFTLQYAGLGQHTALLDGGMPSWVRQGGALSEDVPPTRKGKLSELNLQPLVVNADYVRAHRNAPGLAIVDARATVFYDGIEVGGAHGQTDRTGHIAGAHSVPFTGLTDEQLRLRPLAELKAQFDAAGIAPGDTIVGYCHIGQQATAMLFAARLLGHPVLLYDGSFQDWSRGANNPVETTAARGKP
ncbi:MAG: rhodanese-like domain-containing protein [Dokdonella sp.]